MAKLPCFARVQLLVTSANVSNVQYAPISSINKPQEYSLSHLFNTVNSHNTVKQI